MPKELLLMRHGKAASDFNGSDHARPLKDAGKRSAQRVGVWLQQRALVPDLILASSAERAFTTAEKCAKAMGTSASAVRRLDTLYLADIDELMHTLRGCADHTQRVLLVGHNPGLTKMLTHLAGGNAASRQPMHPASLAYFTLATDWADLDKGLTRLVQLVHAEQLPRGFPYPGPFGEEQRERPAYYYTQSAVIPYRETPEGRQVLIIRSSKNKHWVIPKGIADPGMTLQESAAKEALEEAGIEGRVDSKPLGSYRVAKWGAHCTVTVYAMAVTRELDDAEWEERHRGRRWVTREKAAALLKQPELRAFALQIGN